MNDIGARLRVTARIVEQVQMSESYLGVVNVIASQRRIHLTGVGKSGLIAERAAATWRSFGLDATYEHSTELLHGGLGGVRGIIILVSHSGMTQECLDVADVTRMGTIAFTSSIRSMLSAKCHYTLSYGPVEDTEFALGLPIMVNYVQAALLDSIGLDSLQRREVTKDTIHQWHPGGSIK
jgi:arabinose-5-phosphate isomerase